MRHSLAAKERVVESSVMAVLKVEDLRGTSLSLVLFQVRLMSTTLKRAKKVSAIAY